MGRAPRLRGHPSARLGAPNTGRGCGEHKGGGVVGPVTQRDPVSLRRINPRAVHAPDVHWARARSDAGRIRYTRLGGRRRICETVSG